MKSIAIAAVCSIIAASPTVWANDAENRTPVLVELFTSEGCSSCPPADKLLEGLDRTQPVGGAEIIVLSEHVDYWNQIGWTDPFSSAQFSQRQQAYARRFGIDGPYTPQMVVNGKSEFVGSDGQRATSDITAAAGMAKATVRISPAGTSHRVRVDVEGASNADVFVAVALNEAVSQVIRGENKGRKLRHIAVVKSLAQIGKVTGTTFSKEIDVPKDMPDGAYRVIAFVQEHGQGRVLGSASYKPIL